MKSTTHIFKITNQKNEKYQCEGRNPVACLPSHLTSGQLRNFPREFIEKSFAVLNHQAAQFISCGIGHPYFSGNFPLIIPFMA